MKKKHGLTLIELVIALAVVAVFSAVVSLSFLNNDRRELQNASLKLQADLRYAQRMAIIEGRRWKISFTSDSYILSVYEQNGLQKNQKKVELTHGITLMNYSSADMSYLPRGTSSEGFSVLLTKGRMHQKLTATVSGGRIAIGEIIVG